MNKLSLILLPRSRLQQPSKVHFHLVEPHVEEVASLTWGMRVPAEPLEILENEVQLHLG